MDIQINSDDVIAVLRQRFPKELEISIQAVQIQKLQEKCDSLEDDTEVS